MIIDEIELRCEICGQFSSVIIESVVNHEGWITGQMPSLSLAMCPNCELAFLVPSSALNEQWRWYPESYLARSRNLGLQSFFFGLAQKRSARRFLSEYGRNARILDFGGGDGSWSTVAVNYGLNAKYYDPFAENPANNNGFELQETFNEGVKFDVIRLEHVLEHATNPETLLSQCMDLLLPNGVIVGNTPNVKSIGFNIFKRSWGFLHAPHHPFLFSEKSLEVLAKKMGLSVCVSQSRISSCWGATIENLICTALRLNRRGHLKIYPFLLLLGQLIEFATTFAGRKGSEIQFIFAKKGNSN